MGGRGSGRISNYPMTLDDLRRIDLQQLRRSGRLQPGYRGFLRWTYNGAESASVGLTVDVNTLALIYRSRRSGEGPWENITQLVPLARTAQPLGGARTWLLCPGCQQRCTVLYDSGRFCCRRCVKLPYASQTEQPSERKLRRAQMIHLRLGGSGDFLGFFPDKPKHMRWTTYRKLRSDAEQWNQSGLMDVVERFRLPRSD